MKIISICYTSSTNNVFTEGFFNVCKGIDIYSDLEQIIIASKITFNEISKYHFKNKFLIKFNKKSIINTFKTIIITIKKIKKEKPEIIFIYGENPLHAIICLFINKHIKILTHIADPIPHSDSNKILKALYFISKNILILRSSKILFACDVVKNEALIYFNKYFKKEYLFKKFSILKLGNLYNLNKLILKINNEIIAKKYTFIFYGRITKYKGLDLLISAFSQISEKYKNTSLLICGKGEIKNSNKSIIHINEYIPYDNLLRYIKASQAVVLPYKDATGTHTIQIANSLGIPVIVSNVGCLKGYSKEGINALIFKANDVKSLKNTLIHFLEHNTFDPQTIIDYNRSNFNNKNITQDLLNNYQNLIE